MRCGAYESPARAHRCPRPPLRPWPPAARSRCPTAVAARRRRRRALLMAMPIGATRRIAGWLPVQSRARPPRLHSTDRPAAAHQRSRNRPRPRQRSDRRRPWPRVDAKWPDALPWGPSAADVPAAWHRIQPAALGPPAAAPKPPYPDRVQSAALLVVRLLVRPLALLLLLPTRAGATPPRPPRQLPSQRPASVRPPVRPPACLSLFHSPLAAGRNAPRRCQNHP